MRVKDEEAEAVLRTVGRQIRAWREAAGLTQPELGDAIGYGGEMVSSVERGRRIPKPDFLDKADEALGAGGKLAAMKRTWRRPGIRRRCGTWRSWRRSQSNSAPTPTTTCTASFRSRNTHGALFAMRAPA